LGIFHLRIFADNRNLDAIFHLALLHLDSAAAFCALQRAATHCDTPQRPGEAALLEIDRAEALLSHGMIDVLGVATHCSALQRTA